MLRCLEQNNVGCLDTYIAHRTSSYNDGDAQEKCPRVVGRKKMENDSAFCWRPGHRFRRKTCKSSTRYRVKSCDKLRPFARCACPSRLARCLHTFAPFPQLLEISSLSSAVVDQFMRKKVADGEISLSPPPNCLFRRAISSLAAPLYTASGWSAPYPNIR
ncbi:hypothetical protein TGPRC2_243770 [Toxoplasma gondii TgCatPRC2]|uniref:Uncharacterized protein n=11 Tax=Toxoplasma gondii TaxID=5811 RepID=B9PP30_TOXGV|nr:hypothetical protein TGGT1_243770 [Toxoplasma gondii GT1]ESS31657.1 hypothetical protein TGVEG_243770 [Toxoplasma gondii VEG]KAF4643197.1 hypothetical protein TGRH88_028640 [Toxoplasma gondii]KFG33136.1 hypothetical protein TGDOM2_243770 [Toxoplasma gondii GAB2-2007-GAL-DOM2]KFG51457.1 hypothetical protein TGFOU_243770 [Toxoplasma gondii FOU]KFG60267.1 hypothetical protein TGRUB_243770 [Toxoplasma gondii RUB]KFH04749.1 hypothetical protein TGVAND_243770 [Toxoplasma gondii VAND]KYF41009.1 